MLTNSSKFSVTLSGYSRWRLLSIIIIGLLCGGLGISGYLVLDHVTRALDDANTIVQLNGNGGFDVVNTAAYEKTQTLLQLKTKSALIPGDLRSIFVFTPTTTAFAPATSTPAKSPTVTKGRGTKKKK